MIFHGICTFVLAVLCLTVFLFNFGRWLGLRKFMNSKTIEKCGGVDPLFVLKMSTHTEDCRMKAMLWAGGTILAAVFAVYFIWLSTPGHFRAIENFLIQVFG